jgi:hypothetical protein
VFGKRGCKPLKTNDRRMKKRAKRKQEAASSCEQRSSKKQCNTESAEFGAQSAQRGTPPGFCMDVQTMELREEGFVSL